MVEGFRLYFLVYYGLGIVVALITVATDYLRSASGSDRRVLEGISFPYSSWSCCCCRRP